MSGLAAIVHRDGRPVLGSAIGAMLDAIAHRALDGAWQRAIAPAALGYAKTAVTPEEAREQQPLVSDRTGCAIVADARLDNRAELLARLPDRPAADASDATLILRAYEAWGADAPKHLLGDFAFVIWDPAHRRLVCARDAGGARPLYYRLDPRTFAAGSEIQQLLQDPTVTVAPNAERVRDYLTPWRVFHNEREQPATFFEGISLLPAGHVLVLDEAGVRVRRYWELAVPRELRYRHDQEYVQHFADVFVAAVRDRLRSAYPVAAALSGGLDSTSIVALAQVLYQRGLAEERGFVSFSMAFDGMECDESAFIRELQAQYSFDARFYSPLGLVANLDPHPQGFLAAPMKTPGELDPMLAMADEAGARTLLTGHYGDNVFGWFNRGFDSLLRRARLAELLRQARAYRDMSGASVRGSLACYGLLPLLPLGLQRALGARMARRELEQTWDDSMPAWIGAEVRRAARDLQLGHVLGAERSRRFAGVERQEVYASLYPPEALAVAGAHAVQIARPFGDRRLHELVLALPPEQLFQPHPYAPGYYPGGKLILRRAMRGVLPESIRARTTKPHFTAFVLEEIQRRWPEYAAVFGPEGRSEVAARGYVDPAPFWQRVQRMRAGEFGADGLYVVRVLNLETWLRTFNLPRARQVVAPARPGRPNSPVQPVIDRETSRAVLAPPSVGASVVESGSGRR